jgi:gamma-glutamyltranspeptidase/glutathione hydrolase
MKYQPFSRTLIATALVLTVSGVHAASQAPVAGENGMVVTAQHLATHVGVDVLKSGGNAVDAAVAVGYALAVVYPAAGNLGGGGFMTMQLADGRKTFLDFREKAPWRRRPTCTWTRTATWSRPERPGHLAVGVPGTVSGMELALSKYGTKRARNGASDQSWRKTASRWSRATSTCCTPPPTSSRKTRTCARSSCTTASRCRWARSWCRKTWPRPCGPSPPRARRFLQRLGGRGLVDSSQAGKGIITQADLDKYKTRELAPIECDYRGYHVVSAPPPSSGGVVICEIMNILEGYPMKDLGYHSAQGLHYQIEAMRHAYVDRNSYLGDPDFVKNPIEHLLDKNYATKLRDAIEPNKAGDSQAIKPGVSPHEGNNTTHYSIVDKWGNAVSVTYTLNDWFGAGVMASKTGVILNDEMDDFTVKVGVPNMYGLVRVKPTPSPRARRRCHR